MNFNKIAKLAFGIAQKRWPKNFGSFSYHFKIPTQLALIRLEVSEALETDKQGNYFEQEFLTPEQIKIEPAEFAELLAELLNSKYLDNSTKKSERFIELFEKHAKDTFEDKLADIIIRTIALAASRGIDIERHIMAKLSYNFLKWYHSDGSQDDKDSEKKY